MPQIHPSAVVDPRAELADDVCVDAFSYVGPGVRLGDGCVLHNHVSLAGPATVGPGNTFFPQCVIGADPQDLKYKGGPTQLVIGANNVFREMVTVHRGTEVDAQSRGATIIGDHGLFMIGVHIAHDARIGDHVILANYVQVAGHVHIEDCVNVGGHSAMHHFCTLGRNAYVGGMTRITSDAPPYMKVSGYDADVRAVNAEGMRRWHMPDSSIRAMKRAFRLIYGRRAAGGAGATAAALAQIESDGLLADEHVAYLAAFLRRQMSEGVHGRARERRRSDTDADRAGFYTPNQAESHA